MNVLLIDKFLTVTNDTVADVISLTLVSCRHIVTLCHYYLPIGSATTMAR